MMWLTKKLRRDRTESGAPPAQSPSEDIADQFHDAWLAAGEQDAADPELMPVRLARACVAVLPVAGAGISLIYDDFRVPLGASDADASCAERLQFTTGQGPCLQAVRSGDTVVAGRDQIFGSWPEYGQELFAQTPYGAVISLPLAITTAAHGALDLYLTDSPMLQRVSLADATAVRSQVAEAFQRARAMSSAGRMLSDEPQPAWLHGPAARERTHVWIAMGMVMTRYGLQAGDALALLRAHAYGIGTTLDQLSEELIAGQQDLADLQP
ncbi:MAG: ANTAR domain-containing protein [Jatrophihabitantaceae bacterium]